MDLYSEIILDHFKNPKNKRIITCPDAQANEDNPMCGDKIKIEFKLDKKGKVAEIGFDGAGCAISQAATSMLTEKLIGKTPEQIVKMDNDAIYKMLGIEISPGRVKCALLGLSTAKAAAKKLINTHKTHAK